MSHAYNFTRKPVFSRSDKMAAIAGLSMFVTLILYHYFILPIPSSPSPAVVYTALLTSIVGAVTFVLTLFLWAKEIYKRLQEDRGPAQAVSSSEIDALLLSNSQLLPTHVTDAIAKGQRVTFQVGITIHD